MTAILAAEDRYFATPEHPEHTPPEAVVWRFWRHHPGTVPANLAGELKGDWPSGIHDELQAVAYINHGRWVVDCPRGCGSAQEASRTDRRFFCTECGHNADRARYCGDGCNHHNDLRWIPVIWPSDLEVDTIEAVLAARPEPYRRNWRPGETIEQLVAENTSHGLEPA